MRPTKLPDFDLLDGRKVAELPCAEPAYNPPSHCERRRRTRDMGVLLLFSTVFALGMYRLLVAAPSGRAATLDPFTTTVPPELRTSWAQYSPYFSVEEYAGPPRNCRVTQANIIQRHGARYPTLGAGIMIAAAVNKLLSAEDYTDPRLDFLRNYTYPLGTNDLLPFGARESQLAGKVHFARYQHLVSKGQLPFVRASGSERVVLSATNWTAGFSIASHHVYNPSLSVILSEELNDTLDASMCPNAGGADVQTSQWLLEYGPPIAERLNRQAPGANLTAQDVYSLLSLCPFESVFLNALSPFCKLFSAAEFQQFEYSGDLDKYYNTGYGQPLGPVQGVGYINELIARLTGTPVRDNTQTNRTLDASPETFPLDRTIYADFSHDNQMIAIYAAMGLFRQRTAPDPAGPDPRRTWLAARLVPFAARMVTEKLVCAVAGAGGERGEEEEAFVRVFVNDAVQPLEFCGARGDGMCTLEAFVASQAYARNDGNGDFERCFV
ncbi:putative histidine acid phosphatase family protein [Lyophyllum shimeji]|uniref:Phytase A n=1 Tax=Lyophyllum shimeji TaxID=47721 RepID=A0A9P3PF86_LYOSH|nr:putative histidine acid phosphatase family protein [Lyophyllum shimeji]